MPDIEYAFLADAADARPGQKFAVLGGGVSRIGGPEFPLHHPHLALVVGLLVTAPELNAQHDLRILVLAPDGQEIAAAEAGIMASGGSDGRDAVVTFSLDWWSLMFAAPGDYSVRILVGGSERKRLLLVVERRDDPSHVGDVAHPGFQPPFPPQTGQA